MGETDYPTAADWAKSAADDAKQQVRFLESRVARLERTVKDVIRALQNAGIPPP